MLSMEHLVQLTVRGEYAMIKLTKGKWAKVSPEDADRVGRHRWWAFSPNRTYYAGSKVGGKLTSMHRFILGEENIRGLDVDHIDRDGLNNVRSNLRAATRSQNMANMPKVRGSSKYKGVSLCKATGKWAAHIRGENSRSVHLGRFKTEEEAYAAYCKAARELRGEFALLA